MGKVFCFLPMLDGFAIVDFRAKNVLILKHFKQLMR